MLKIEYVAGLFDGEGCIRIGKFTPPGNKLQIRYSLYLMIGMTHRPLINLLCKNFGGTVHANDHSRKNKKHRTQWCWIISSKTAAEFLRKIQPFCIVKADEIKVALELQDRIDNARDWISKARGKGNRRDAEMAAREILYRRISELKHVAFPV